MNLGWGGMVVAGLGVVAVVLLWAGWLVYAAVEVGGAEDPEVRWSRDEVSR